MLKLKELRFSGIGRFLDEQVINFELLGRLVQLDGLNKNTKGSSGAGKSTVFMALDYLFGISNRTGTVLKCRYSDNPIVVQGTFDYDGKPLVVTRGKKLKIDYCDGRVIEGSSKIAEEELDKILAIPRELFRPMMHKRQKEGGFFLNLTPKDTNEFLIDCLNLGKYRTKLVIVDGKIDGLIKTREALTQNLLRAQSGLQGVQESLSLAIPPTKEIEQSAIFQLKTKADSSAAELKEALARHKLEIDSIPYPTIETAPFDRSGIKIMEDQIRSLKDEIAKLNQQEKDRQAKINLDLLAMKNQKSKLEEAIEKGRLAAERSAKLVAEIKKIRDSMCPTCDQIWVTEKAKITETQLLDELKATRGVVEFAKLAMSSVPEINSSVLELQNQLKPQEIPYLNDYLNNIKEIENGLVEEKAKEKAHQGKQAAMSKIVQDEHALKSRLTRERCSQEQLRLSGQAEIDRRALDMAVGKLRAYEEATIRHRASLDALQAKLNEYSGFVKDNSDRLAACVDELAKAEELKRAVKSHLSCSFDQALLLISNKATELIRNIPNMANATIQLEGMWETQDGKVKEEVNAVIHMDGEQNVDIRSLCGGERTSTDLAIDLAVVDLIETQAKKGIDIFILDEPFEGLDTVCIEMALEVLKNSNTGKRVIIVDHNSEVKEAVESSILVVRSGALSKIEQAA